MAAYKAGCDTVIIPQDNIKDLDEISDEVKSVVNFIAVAGFDEIIPIALDEPLSKIKNTKMADVVIPDKKARTSVITQ